MAKNRGIITTTQDAITDVARTGIEGARSIAGSAAIPRPALRTRRPRP